MTNIFADFRRLVVAALNELVGKGEFPRGLDLSRVAVELPRIAADEHRLRKGGSGEERCTSRNDETGPVTTAIRQALIDIQFGRAEDSFGWLHRVV